MKSATIPFLCLYAICAASTGLLAADAPRPNILYLYVDDMGWGSIGPNGQDERRKKGLPNVLTPNLDKLAAAGVNFQRGYGCTVCSPARSSQQSGFHQGHTFADRNDPDNAKKALRTDDVTMGDALAAAGYITGYWGKWGYGGSSSKTDPKIDNIQTLPTSHGYKHVVAELHHVRAHTFFQPTLWTAPAKANATGGLELKPNSMAKFANNKAYPEYPALQSHPKYPRVAYCDDVYAFAALDFVRNQAMNYNKTGQPFFGLFAAQIPHAPFGEITALPDWNAAYKDKSFFSKLNKQSQTWAAMVTRIDAHFGNLLAALEDPNNDGDTSDSVAANTLVVFQSDNGGPGGPCRSEIDSNGGLSGSKGGIQEGGIRVPTIVRWPAKITANSRLKAGSNTNIPLDATDLLPTFCDLAGAPTPVGIDGVSLAPTLQSLPGQRVRDFLIHEAGAKASIIRGDYKLVMTRNAGKTKPPKKNKKKKAPAKPSPKAGSVALYHLGNDHAEKDNIASKHPDRVNELKALLIGERVTEPAGFANTYHDWTGKSGAKTSDASNWSDYIYANAGITYTTDDGAPQASWTTRMHNIGSKGAIASVDADLNVLGLEIGGKTATQELNLGLSTAGKTVTVTGRNEIRIAKNGVVSLNRGTLESLRWVDVRPGGALRGGGTIHADLHLRGTLSPAIGQNFVVSGDAHLGGTLTLNAPGGVNAPKGKTLAVLAANRVTGRFSNEIVQAGPDRFKISYTQTSVSITKL